MKRPELPKGVAAYFSHNEDWPDTVCVLVRAEGKENNVLPTTISKWEILATGMAFYSRHETAPENRERGEVISLGRALKAYRKKESQILKSDFTISYTLGSSTWGGGK